MKENSSRMGPLTRRLFEMQDTAYRAFQIRLIPTVPPERIIGVRTPELRRLARSAAGTPEGEAFLSALPHEYFDENQLHAFLLSEEKDFERCVGSVEAFLPYVDNWATCDQMSPRTFGRHRQELLPYIRRWLGSGRTYTVRFAVGMLMQYFLDGNFDPAYLEWAAAVRSEEYYVNMMVAWYFATALAKQFDAALPFIENGRLDGWTHCKAIRKAVESDRVSPEHKAYLKSLKNRGRKGNG